MSMRSRLRTWWRAIWHADDLRSELSEELRFHLDARTEDLAQRGLPRAEAMRRARAEMGSVAAAQENARSAWGTRWADELRGDLKYALRSWSKSPAFVLVAIGSLALGIGANTVIFSTAENLLLRRIDVPHAEQLRLFTWTQGCCTA